MTTRPRCGWVGEQETRTETNTPKAGMQRIPVHELYAMPKATQKLLEDSALDVEAGSAARSATSSAAPRRPRSSPATASRSRAASPPMPAALAAGGSGKIEQVAAGTAGPSASSWDDLINMLTALKEFYLGGASG
jgi:predicted phage gp36 major capsid-like protein